MSSLPQDLRRLTEAHWTPEEDALLLRRRLAGKSPAELARLHGRDAHAIRERLTELGSPFPRVA